MNTKTLRVLADCAVIGAGVLLWHLLRMEADAASRPYKKGPAVASAVAGKGAVAPLAWRETGTPQFKTMARQRALPWLDARGRDAAGLIALWDLTGDETLLKEAAEKFPDDPQVCMAMIQQAGGNPQQAMPWIESLLATEPADPEGLFLKAWALESSGNRTGAIAALHKMSEYGMSNIRFHRMLEGYHALREVSVVCGLSEREGALIAVRNYRENGLNRLAIESASQALRLEMDAAQALGRKDLVEEMGILGQAIPSHRGAFSSPWTFQDESAANNLQRAVLSRLPEDMPYGNHGVTIKDLKARAMEQCILISTKRKEPKTGEPALLQAATEEVVIEYGERFLLGGEADAMTWLNEQARPVK